MDDDYLNQGEETRFSFSFFVSSLCVERIVKFICGDAEIEPQYSNEEMFRYYEYIDEKFSFRVYRAGLQKHTRRQHFYVRGVICDAKAMELLSDFVKGIDDVTGFKSETVQRAPSTGLPVRQLPF